MKTEPGSLPEGKVKIKLEHDGTILDVDEDDVEKVSGSWLQMFSGTVVQQLKYDPVQQLLCTSTCRSVKGGWPVQHFYHCISTYVCACIIYYPFYFALYGHFHN